MELHFDVSSLNSVFWKSLILLRTLGDLMDWANNARDISWVTEFVQRLLT